MTYSTVEKQIRSVPEEYLDEIAEFADYVLYKARRKQNLSSMEDTSVFFGCITRPIDGLAVQRNMRDEWD